MPGRKIPLITGEYYHVFNRGVNRQIIFQDAYCYKRCKNQLNYYKHQSTPFKYSKLRRLKTTLRQAVWQSVLNSPKQVEIIAYCLMPNHFHLLLKQNVEGGISRFMSNFQNSYSRYYNVKIDRSGPLLTGKFQAVKIDTTEQLLHVSRYIHLNPATSYQAKTLKSLLKYQWSSLPEYTNENLNKICDNEIVLNSFHSTSDYLEFLGSQIEYQRELSYLKHLQM